VETFSCPLRNDKHLRLEEWGRYLPLRSNYHSNTSHLYLFSSTLLLMLWIQITIFQRHFISKTQNKKEWKWDWVCESECECEWEWTIKNENQTSKSLFDPKGSPFIFLFLSDFLENTKILNRLNIACYHLSQRAYFSSSKRISLKRWQKEFHNQKNMPVHVKRQESVCGRYVFERKRKSHHFGRRGGLG
jgi:hypothetical protein